MSVNNARMKRLEKALNKSDVANYSPTAEEFKLRTEEIPLYLKGKIDAITPYKIEPKQTQKQIDYREKLFDKYLN